MGTNLERVKEHAKDLRKEEPRPAHERLAGYELAARCLDKCRATLLGWQGDFMFNCAMDQMFLNSAGIDAGKFKDFVASGASDREVEQWIKENAAPKAD
jgi:hypothetical protein